MSILDTFFVLFKSNTEELDKGLNESEKKTNTLLDKFKSLDKTSTETGKNLHKVLTEAAGLLGIGVSIGALIHGVKETAAAYDDLAKLAARFRATAEAVDEFRDAAGLLGIDEEKSAGALKGLESAIQDTFLGLGRAKKVFEELGIQITDAAGKIKPTTTVMDELADKLSKMEKGTQIRVMERLGLDPSLLKLFNSDLAALQRRMGDIDRTSGFNLENAVRRAGEYTKAQKELTLEVNTLRMFFDKLIEKYKIAALPWFTDGLKTMTKYVKIFTEYLMQHSKFVEGAFIAIGAAISYFLVPAAIRGAIAVWAMIAPFALIVAIVVAVGAAFALLYEDVMTFIEGGDSLIGRMLARWPIIGDIVGAIVAAFKELWAVGEQVFDFFVDLWNDPMKAFQKFLSFIIDGVKAILHAIPGVGAALDWVSRHFGSDDKAPKTRQGAVNQAAAMGQQQLAVAASSPVAAATANSIMGPRVGSSHTNSVQIDKVEVATQATDAAGISKAIGGTLDSQMRQAVNNWDDGVLA